LLCHTLQIFFFNMFRDTGRSFGGLKTLIGDNDWCHSHIELRSDQHAYTSTAAEIDKEIKRRVNHVMVVFLTS